MSEKSIVSVHWSFWVIGAAALIFNLLGCVNFVSQMNAEVVASMPDMYRAMIESRPAWGTAVFALAVFGGAIGSLLLLLRKSFAIYAFIVSLVGTVASQIPFLGIANFPGEAWVGWLSQLAVGAFLVWYSKLAENKHWIES